MATNTHQQKGFVSILTVLFFITLISVITVSFTRFMIQERRQELEDEQTKSAYNSALAGVEDAKQAISYCATAAADKATCEAYLYSMSCPGFNSSIYFEDIGIKQSTSGKTSVTGEDVASAAQGYSCVVVTKDTRSVDGRLSSQLGSGAMYELRTTSPYNKIRIYWQQEAVVAFDTTTLATGNPRLAAWNTNWPDMLRINVIALPNTSPFNISDINQWQTSLYPTHVGATARTIILNPGALAARQSARCDLPEASVSGYRCYVDLQLTASRSDKFYILLNATYRPTDYSIVAFNGANEVLFNAVQPTIDATGYTSGIARRVVARVHVGGQSINTSSAIDTGFGLCKDFRVGTVLSTFRNDVAGQCD